MWWVKILSLLSNLPGMAFGLLGQLKFVIGALVIGLTIGYVKGCADEREHFALFRGGVEALGRQAEQRAAETIKENLAHKEKADAELKALRSRSVSLARQLRNTRANSRDLSAAAAAAAGAPRASINRAELFREVGRLDAGLSGLAEQADAERDGLNAAKRWAQDMRD